MQDSNQSVRTFDMAFSDMYGLLQTVERIPVVPRPPSLSVNSNDHASNTTRSLHPEGERPHLPSRFKPCVHRKLVNKTAAE